MKKILILIIFVVFPLLLNAQLIGSGTYADPWSGTLSGNTTWSGTKYINGDITVDNEKLTISSGATIIFLAEGADLIITATGQLEANGTSGSMIRFTSDDDNDGIYGETGERWGHISFQSMGSAGNSLINFCIIEFGYKDNGQATVESYGGAIYAGFSNLTISHSILRNNYAGYGGGILIKDNTSPIITSNYIHDNTVSKGGGGIFIHFGVNSIIDNCLITYNRCTGGGGGGGIYVGPDASAKILNTTISKNSTLYPTAGDNIVILQNTLPLKPSFINCIIWSSNSSVAYVNQTPSVTDFINCAIQNPVSGSTTNCISLNATNTNIAGPNFVATDGSNWIIQPWSPCVDIGNNTAPNVPVIDYAGNGRIGPVDAGAYECQFYKWQGDDATTPTVWNVADNWNSNSVPSGNEDIYISKGLTNYPVSSSGQNYTIGPSKSMILAPGAKTTLGTLTNNGSLSLQSDATGISTFMVNSHLGNAANVQLYLTGGYIGNPALRVGRWHYISSPFDPSTPLSVSPFTANTYDLARWVDGIQSPSSILLGFVAYDGFVYNDSDPGDPGTFWGGTFSSLTTGRGYNFWDNLSSFNYSLNGKLNTADLPVTLDFAGAAYENGYNLLGNPFSSGLNWDDIINSVYFTYPLNTSKSLYFTRDNVSCSYIAGVGVPADVTGLIPPMQGFFTKTYSTGNIITLAAAARVHDNIHARYKGQTIIPLIRLEIDKDSLLKDETVVRFDDKALTTLDNEFDALKMFLSASKTSIYSSDGNSKYSINGQPFPATEVQIPVIINLQYSGNHKISTNQLQGLDNYYVSLKDNTTGFTADLKTTPEILFSADAGTSSGRFVLKISTIITGIENPSVTNGIFNIYPGQNLLNIQTIADEWDGKSGSVRVLDLTGKTVSDLNNAEFTKNSLVRVQSPAAKGLYVVEIRSGVKRYVGKVVIK